ncbi:MAG: hypothetical protein J6R64_06680 [Lentisphaeria bacterium]|nr:hypothetical protein [Lentisphaeria bacterium]
MKKSCSNFLLTSLKVGMPVFAVACFAITVPVNAAEKAPAQLSIQKEVNARSKEFQEILKDLADVEGMAKVDEGKEINFAEAFAKLKAIKAKLDTKLVELKGDREAILYYDGVVKRFNDDHAAFGALAAEAKFQQAKKLYESAAKAGVSSASAEKALEAKELAEDACYTYYVNPLDSKAVRDPEWRDKKITVRNQDFAVRVAQLKAACEKITKAYEFRVQTDTAAVDPNYANRMDKISKLYARANNLYRDSQYTQARDLCEQIFIEDPTNAKAIALLDKIYKKLYFYSELRAYNEILRSDAETIWLWSNAVPASGNRAANDVKREVKDPLMEKLSSWKISVAFADYSIKDAITMIREKSQEVDPRKLGVNFLERGIAGTDTENVAITLELDNVPISVVLNYLCKKAGISWKTSEAFVLYGHGISDYESTEIPMRNSVYHTITSANEEEEEGEGGEEEGGWGARGIDSIEKTITTGGGKKRGAVSDKKLRAFFVERGIPFDDRSSVIYNPKTHKLAVTNTRENLQKLELLVREIDVETPLVLIESKILEITVNDEEELGFDWTATYTNDKNSAYNFSFGSPLRSVAPSAVNAVEGIVNDKLINNLNIIPNMNLNGGHQLNFYLTVSAVDRTDRLEQLSTPKVVVKNGDTAVIKMVKSMYFPDSWEAPDTEIDDGDVAMETSYPEFGEPDEVGIQFTVTPTVSSNKYTVQLDLEPSITDLTGWTDYSYDMVIRRNPLEDEDINTDNEDGTAPILPATVVSTDLFRVNIKMPEISKRELITKLKCFDAQTMMVGGMVLDKQVNMEDRYPILGDLPIVGRLFTKAANTSSRSNLLISVSPRLISGDGVPINARPDNGIPDFRFRK